VASTVTRVPAAPRFLTVLASVLLGVVVGALGTVAHASVPPWGVVVALALTVAASTMVRAWAGRAAVVGFVLGLAAAVLLLAGTSPSGDVLVARSDPLGWVWMAGSVALAAAVLLAPRAMFSDAPRPPRERFRVPDRVPASPTGTLPATDEPTP
jgi:hypothetical protein